MNKICMLSSGHSPLDDRIYYKEVLSLVQHYPSITIVAPEDSSGYQIDEAGIEFIYLRKKSSLVSRFLIILQAIITILKIRPEICHFHDFDLIFALPFLRLFSRCKFIYDVHEVYPEMAMESKKIPRLIRPFLSKIVDVSEIMLSHLTDYIVTADDNISERFCNRNGHVSTIFNYPRLSLFIANEAKLSQLKRHYQNRTPIIYQGGISEDRGLFQMIRAMNILKEKRPDIILLLVGKMSDEILNKSKEVIRNKGLQNNVDIVGWVSHKDVVNYICISKIGLIPLLPTRKFLKNIPIKQFEYMACGIPVLGANLLPIASYINSSGCGKVFDSTSSDALASGVIDILQSESEWRRMSEAGKRAVQNWWNWDEMEKRLFSVYKKLLNST